MAVFTRVGASTHSVKVMDACLLRSHCYLIIAVLNQIWTSLFCFGVFPGLVGDILLNNKPLWDFTIYSLDMKPSFIDRFVLPDLHSLSLVCVVSLL